MPREPKYQIGDVVTFNHNKGVISEVYINGEPNNIGVAYAITLIDGNVAWAPEWGILVWRENISL